MGVSGSGKTTVGLALAERLGWRFFDADAYHPPENIDKMAAGKPLNDADRQPWLETLRDLIRDRLAEGRSLVLACSALKQRYRDILQDTDAGNVTFVYLRGDFEIIEQRMQQREHFMRPELLQSQFDALEAPTDAIGVDIDRPVDDIVHKILADLSRYTYAPKGTAL